MKLTLYFSVFSFILFTTAQSQAQVPDAIFTINGVGPTTTNPGTVQFSNATFSNGSFISEGQSTVTPGAGASDSPVVTVLSLAFFQGNGFNPVQGDSIGATADMTYYFEVVGPAASVNLDVSGNFADQQADPMMPAISAVSIAGNAYSLFGQPLPSTINVPTNTLETVTIQSSANITNSAVGTSEGGVDELALNLDPSTPNLNAYTVEFSPNLVPEPASLGLIGLASFGLLKQKHSR